MFCPRCGTPNEPGDRFCSSCGASLKSASSSTERSSPRLRISSIVGDTRKARLITVGTAVALIVAVVGFIALKPSEESIPRDAYTISADRLCLQAKAEIVAAERQFGRRPGDRSTSAFAGDLVPIVATWRSQLTDLKVPSDRAEQVQMLDAALLEAETQVARLARIAAEGNAAETVASAKRADIASAQVEEAVSALGLSRCAAETIGLSPS